MVLVFGSLFDRGGLWLYCLGGIERGVRYSYSGLEILHGGVGGDVELGARTSKHILLLAFDPLVSQLSLSLHLCKASFFIHIIHIACVALHYFILLIILICLACLCVPHLYLTTRASHSCWPKGLPP